MGSHSTGGSRLKRRDVIQALGAAGAAGLAGCNSSEGGAEDLGERVPDVVVEYWSDIGTSSTIMEQSAQMMQNDVEDLGFNFEIEPVQFTTQTGNTLGDERTHHLSYWTHSSPPSRLDPDELVGRFSAANAGPDGSNPANYANCEYTHPAEGQRTASSNEERQEFVTEALSVGTEDSYAIPTHPRVTYGAYNPNLVDIGGVGEAGLKPATNPYVFFETTPTQGDTVRTHVDPQFIETTNFLTVLTPTVIGPWSHLVHSSLLEYDQNLDLQNMLAESFEEENEGETIRVTLRDASFHNGDPVTAEDVQFTFQYLAEHGGSVFPAAESPSYESIKVIDEKTVEFTFSDVYRPIYGRTWARWGILHKQSWIDAGAEDDPQGVELDEIIGSGPFQVDDYQIGSYMQLEPFDGHPIHSVDHNLLLETFSGGQSLLQAFQNEDLDFVYQIDPAAQETLEENMGDSVVFENQEEFTQFHLYPQDPIAPTKFPEFRKAIGMAFNRQRIHDVVFRGAGSIEYTPCVLGETHPWRPPEEELTPFTDQAEPDIEGAREVLSEAGWGWDNGGNLHYPEDADLSPKWPDGENPTSEQFPCLDDEGNYAGSD